MLSGSRVLDESNSRRYRSRPDVYKFAVFEWRAADYPLERGVEMFHGPHIKVRNGNGWYGVQLAVFFETHKCLPGHAHCYVKSVEVRAARVSTPTAVRTSVGGSLEMAAQALAGDFIVRNPKGEEYVMPAEEFLRRYDPVD
jgi:hypothetical protein